MDVMTGFLTGYVVAAGAGLAGDPGLKASRQSTGGALSVFETSIWTPTGFVDTIRSGTMVYEERTGSGTGSQEVHPGI